ncbi:MAG: class I SAM-dependent methyltransferase [Bdellovibrionota bacterium]
MHLRRLVSHPEFTIDQYGTFAWVNAYSDQPHLPSDQDLVQNDVECAVMLLKSKNGLPTKPTVWFGDVPETLIANEDGIQYEIRCLNSFHPGLFLDHQRTRQWLKDHSQGCTLLNLFSYTGSLGISAAMGGAIKTINIDLSNPTTQWAKKNAELNGLGPDHQFIKGDVFDWTQRFKKKNQTFDIVVSDPPSQSRSDEMHFSTQKHLDLLHQRCIDCVAPGGTLITSINTEVISEKVMIASVHNVAHRLGRKIKTYTDLPLPDGFESEFRAMKGLRVSFA